MIAAVATGHGVYAVDVEAETVLGLDVSRARPKRSGRSERASQLPRVVAADEAGATVVAVVDAKPPLLVSHDAGTTWSESGRGLPAGRDVAVSAANPDHVLYATRNRLYVSIDGGRFWRALPVELPEIDAVAWEPS